MRETIFMVHGMSGGAWHWDNYKNYFEKDFSCITPTLRFHDMHPNDDPHPDFGTTSLLDYADDLEQEILELDDKPILMGHSMGGLIAQILASRGLAKAVVLLMPGAPAGILAVRPSVLKGLLGMQPKWGFWKKPILFNFKASAYSLLNNLPTDVQKEIYAKFVYESGRAIFELACWPIDSKNASTVDESKVTCPVLVVSGGKDRIIPAAIVRKVARKYKHVSTYKEFKDTSHWGIADPNWQEITEYVAGWLNKILPEKT